jgi:hypothetical protein
MDLEKQKRVTIKISKKITHYYDAEKKLLIPINSKKIYSFNPIEKEFHLKLQFILTEVKLSEKNFVKKVLQFLSPSNLAEKMIEYKKQNPHLSLKKLLNKAEFDLIQEISTKVIGTDDDPIKIYDFLGNILKETSFMMNKKSQEFAHQLTQELYNKGIEL